MKRWCCVRCPLLSFHPVTYGYLQFRLPTVTVAYSYLYGLPMCAEMEAVALFDYVARSPAELSFKVGELVVLHSKASCDWWRGEVGGVKGLIPHKYISVLEG